MIARADGAICKFFDEFPTIITQLFQIQTQYLQLQRMLRVVPGNRHL